MAKIFDSEFDGKLNDKLTNIVEGFCNKREITINEASLDIKVNELKDIVFQGVNKIILEEQGLKFSGISAAVENQLKEGDV